MWTILLTSLTALGLIVAPPRPDDDQRKQDKGVTEQFIGEYRLIGGERNGKKLESAELEGVRVRIAANAISTYDKENKEIYVASFKIENKSSPYRISMTATVSPGQSEGTKSQGLLKKTDDTVTLIYTLPGGKAPVDFKTGDHQQMFVLQKIEK